MSKWDDPDPRVKWALDKFDDDGYEQTSLAGYLWPIVGGSALMAVMQPIANFAGRRCVADTV